MVLGVVFSVFLVVICSFLVDWESKPYRSQCEHPSL